MKKGEGGGKPPIGESGTPLGKSFGMRASGSAAPPYDIRQRTFRFACAIVSFHRGLPEGASTLRRLSDQVLKAGTSVGANLEEAKAASSKRDFVAKTAIGLRECRETLYWLRLIHACRLTPPARLDPLIAEADELVAILTSIVRRSRAALAVSVVTRGTVLTTCGYALWRSVSILTS